jgi:hypothetical protein
VSKINILLEDLELVEEEIAKETFNLIQTKRNLQALKIKLKELGVTEEPRLEEE